MSDEVKTEARDAGDDHAWVHEHVEAALAGGLTAAEQARFDGHINGCAECFDSFTEARDADRAMQRAVAELAATAKFEDSLVETLRETTMHKRHMPAMKRAGMAIAAAVALAATGVFAQYLVGHDGVTKDLAGRLTGRMVADARSRGITIPLSFLGDGNGKLIQSVSGGASSDAEKFQVNDSSVKVDELQSDKFSVGAGVPGNSAWWEMLGKTRESPKQFMEKSDPVGDVHLKSAFVVAGEKVPLDTVDRVTLRASSDRDEAWNSDRPSTNGQNAGFGDAHAEFPRHADQARKLGDGTLAMDDHRSFTGATTVSGGTLLPGKTTASDSGDTVNMNGGTLRYSNGNTIDRVAVGGIVTKELPPGDVNQRLVDREKGLDVGGKLGLASSVHSTASVSSYYKPDVAVPVFDIQDLDTKGENVKPPRFDLSEIARSNDVNKGDSSRQQNFVSNFNQTVSAATPPAPLTPPVNDEVVSRSSVNTPASAKVQEVGALMQQAQDADQQHNYKEAADQLRHLLVIDPTNDAAKLSLKLISDKMTYTAWQSIKNDQSKGTQNRTTDDQENLIPYTDLLPDPENWVDLTQRRVADAGKPDATHNGSAVATTQGAPAPVAPAAAQLKIIRNGEVDFEVRSFDDASAMISKVVTEEGGYVSSTSSEKLANGKIRGTVIVRVPPERLDRLLLKLRALGDLKTQQIAANDVTKQYVDTDSELRALRAMESRMIDLIKNGKGDVKDLVVAEKQLGEYRVRIEKLEGDLRYYDNLVGMATLSIVAYEKDIQKPTAAAEQENVTLALETEDVEAKYKDARKILEDAKGRIVESELKRLEADQYSANIIVDVPPDKADFVIGQLRQLGRVANYTRDRKQTTSGGTGVPTVQVEEKDTRFVISMYNLANVAPRETAVLTVAVRDVEGSYRKVIETVRKPVVIQLKPGEKADTNFVAQQPTGRVVTSNIAGQLPQQMVADIHADVRQAEADGALAAIRQSGEVLTSMLTENADTANTTSAKEGIQLHLVNEAAVPARETQQLRVVAANVVDAYGKLLGTLQRGNLAANVRIISSQLNESDPRTVTANLSFEVQRDVLPAVYQAFTDAGINYLSRNITRSNDTANTLDSKVLFQIQELLAADALAPRRTTVLGVEVDNVEKSLDSLRSGLSGMNVKEVEYSLAKDGGRVTGHLVIETPVGSALAVLERIKDLGGAEKVNQVTKNSQVPEAAFAHERIDLTLMSREAIVESGKGLGATIRAALGSSATALLYSLYLITTGVLFLGPFLIVVWIVYRLARRRRAAAT